MISVVVPTYNRKSLLQDCLKALFVQTYPKEKFEIIIIDDGSTDSIKTLIKKLKNKNPNLRYYNQPHLGVIRARNLGIKKAKGEIIVFTDDDCLVDKNWLTEIEAAFKKNPHALGIEGKTITRPDKVTPLTTQIVNTKGEGFQTCNIAYHRKNLEKLGGLDEKFGFAHCEDVDLALRILKHGPIIFEPKAIVIHPPIKTSFGRELTRVYRIPAELYLFLKHSDYFQRKYGDANVFLQVVFKNSIWIRLFHLKFYSNWIRKNSLIYLRFFIRTMLEIGLIIFLVPKFWLEYQRMRSITQLPEASS